LLQEEDAEMTDAEITRAATRYMGNPALATVGLAIAAVGCWGALLALSVTDQISVWLALPPAAYLVYATYTPLHEAVHKNIAGRDRRLARLNDLTGYVVASILGVSYTMHKAAHMAHHRHTNVQGDDPDLVYSGNQFYDALTGGPKIVWNEYRDYFQRVYPRASSSEKRTVIVEILIALAWRAGLGYLFPLEFLVLGVLANVLGVMILGYIFAWVVHTPFNQTQRFRDTATILISGPLHKPLTWLWLWQNYHSIHHLFPRVPFFRYAELFDDIRDGMLERGAPIRVLSLKGRRLQSAAI